mmetsp:Transcript_47092/g.120126  ORF Transcript_47092/g.120126 Transcript_47092/m.120126 type:complete len:101 (+) Transcript_47092:296-598(+)|eukprot:jgi/Tetstr1/440941/TSEL_029210.t1
MPVSYGAFVYEVFGKVQGVSFRKYTERKAKELGLVGWVMNTEAGTVVGEAQGPAAQLAQLRSFLQRTGSPKSRIDRAEFREERAGLSREELAFKDFVIRK